MMSEVLFNKEYELSDLVSFVGEKIEAGKVTIHTYISTDNMLVDRGGVESATKLPSASRFNHFKAGDTLFSNIRTYFRKVWLADFEGGASPDVLIFRTNDPKILDPGYLYFLLSNEDFVNYTVLTAKGAKMPRGDKAAIMQYKFFLPEIEKQREIGKGLLTINSKIKLNRQTNQTLEQIAQAIFKNWFIDFAPTRAKAQVRASVAEGRMPGGDQNLPEGFTKEDEERLIERAAMAAISGKSLDELDQLSPGQQEQLKTTAALFPDALADSEVGEIPEGWEVNYLNEVTEIAYGKNLPTKKLVEEGYPVFGGNGIIGFFEKYLYENPMTLVACRGAASGKVLRSLPKSFVTNNSLIIDHEKKGYLTQSYIEPCLKRYGLAELTSGSAQPQMTIANMNPVQIVVPSREVIEQHKRLVGPMFEKILQHIVEISILESVRETMLPKLLSGELSIETEDAV